MHRTISPLLVASILVTGVATIGAPVSAAAAPQTRWVDDDGRAGPDGCGGTGWARQSIQSAVDASGRDDMVVVCPGTYDGQVHIHGKRDGLTLRAAVPFLAQIRAPQQLGGALGLNVLVFIDQVDGVTVQGFRMVTRTAAPCESLEATVLALGSQRTTIRGNRLQAPGTIGGTCIQNIGIAVIDAFGTGSPTVTATIASNEVRDAAFFGIAAAAQSGGRVIADIAGNTVRAWFGQPPAGKGPAAIGPISGFGIGLLGRAAGSIRGNVVQGAKGAPESAAAFEYGIVVAPTFVSSTPVANGDVVVRGNLVRRVVVGLWLAGARGVRVRGNVFHHVVIGLGLWQARDNRIAGNDVLSTAGGLWLMDDSRGNRLVGNDLAGAGGSCRDESTGFHTAGTANDWSHNTATHASTPAGICRHVH